MVTLSLLLKVMSFMSFQFPHGTGNQNEVSMKTQCGRLTPPFCYLVIVKLEADISIVYQLCRLTAPLASPAEVCYPNEDCSGSDATV